VFSRNNSEQSGDDSGTAQDQREMRLPIEKRHVWEAYLHVRRNKGSHGVDNEDWSAFEANRNRNLYVLWNRMSSGSYFPKPVRRVMIPKSGGGERPLGIPTITDRIAQEVLRRMLEPVLEPKFHSDSYAYRPGRSAHDALEQCRYRTDYYSWVVDVDIKGYFDNIPHDKLMQAVKHYHPEPTWYHTYLWRILKAPVQLPDGSQQESTKGVPQGGVISPLLSNLYLHVVFDQWISKAVRAKFAFERYADDIVIHSGTEESARFILKILKERFGKCGLEIHPEKSKLVQTELRKDVAQRREYGTSFDFLGHRFTKGTVRTKDGAIKLLYRVCVSPKAKTKMLNTLHHMHLHRRIGLRLEHLATDLNKVVRGWVNYYGRFARSSLQKVLAHINMRLVKWCMKKYDKWKGAALRWVNARWKEQPALFVHWQQTAWFCYPFRGKASQR